MNLSFKELDQIAQRSIVGDFYLFMSICSSTLDQRVRITLEKGSYGSKVHMKVEGAGETPSEAFEAALRNFPTNPLDGGEWTTHRLTAHQPSYEDGQFTESAE